MRYGITLLLFFISNQFTFSQVDDSLNKKGQSNYDTSAVFTCAFLEECSLTTNNAAKIWCTEVSLQTIILERYSFPQLTDTTTFEKREKYLLEIHVNTLGKIDSVKISGGSNEIVNTEIIKAVNSAGITFIPAKDNAGKTVSFTYNLKLRSHIFSNAFKIGLGISPQQPKEVSDEELEQQGKSLRTYRMN